MKNTPSKTCHAPENAPKGPARYKLVYEGGTGEITEKKSRFIATVKPATSEAEAYAFIETVKKKYWDARHNCHAFVIGLNNEITRCSDDGEPAGTAGKPMLDVLLGNKLHNTAVVVTRYFGGTLLGTGGLVRAYSSAVQEGLRASTIIEKCAGTMLCVRTDYTGIGKIQYIASSMNIPILDTHYTDTVTMEVLTDNLSKNAFIKKVTEATSGSAALEETGTCYYADVYGKTMVFES